VQAVEVALAENRARVGAAGEIPRALIESAIDEAGYKVVAVHPA
jgi:copper chaperone CopZ